MARKFLKRLLPDPDKIKTYKALQYLGSRIHEPNLWHLNRRSVALAVAIAFFLACFPIPGHMLFAAFLAFYLRANLPISVIVVWVSNPLTMPAIYYGGYLIGSWILMDPAVITENSVAAVAMDWSQISKIWQPLLLGCFILGTCSAVLGYFTVRSLWRWHTVQNWQARLAARKAQKPKDHS